MTPALNVMIIVEVSQSARNLATLENYSFFYLFEYANAPEINAKGILACPFSSEREIQLAVRALGPTYMVSLLTPCTVIHAKTSGRNRIHLNYAKVS